MAVLEDTLNEFRKAKPPEKVLIIGGSLAVVAVALYLHAKSSASASSSPAQASTSASSGTPGTPQSGLQTFPYGSQPVLDSSGNPVAVIGPPETNPTPAPTTPPPGAMSGPILGAAPAGAKFGFGQTMNVNGTTYTLGPGTNGNVWGVPGTGWNLADWNRVPIGQGGKVLVYGPTNTNPPKQGGGAFGTRVGTHHGVKTSPSKEGHSYTARVYARRIAMR